MQHRSYVSQNISSVNKPLNSPATGPVTVKKAPPQDDLSRIFNSAILSSQSRAKRDFSSELRTLTESIFFKAILNSIRQVARIQGISDRQAAEQVIETFRKIDDLWGEYVFREGLEKLHRPRK